MISGSMWIKTSDGTCINMRLAGYSMGIPHWIYIVSKPLNLFDMWCQIFQHVSVDSLEYRISTLHSVHSTIVWSSEHKAREGFRGFGRASGRNATHPILVIGGNSNLFTEGLDDSPQDRIPYHHGRRLLAKNTIESPFLTQHCSLSGRPARPAPES